MREQLARRSNLEIRTISSFASHWEMRTAFGTHFECEHWISWNWSHKFSSGCHRTGFTDINRLEFCLFDDNNTDFNNHAFQINSCLVCPLFIAIEFYYNNEKLEISIAVGCYWWKKPYSDIGQLCIQTLTTAHRLIHRLFACIILILS